MLWRHHASLQSSSHPQLERRLATRGWWEHWRPLTEYLAKLWSLDHVLYDHTGIFQSWQPGRASRPISIHGHLKGKWTSLLMNPRHATEELIAGRWGIEAKFLLKHLIAASPWYAVGLQVRVHIYSIQKSSSSSRVVVHHPKHDSYIYT